MPLWLQQFIPHYGYFGLYALFMLGIFGLPIPEETILGLAGYLVRRGQLSFVPALAAVFLGSITGMTLNYGLGRVFGKLFTRRYGRVLRISPQKLERVERWFEHYGRWALAFGYFVPGVRHLTAIVAGSSRLPYRIFAPFAYCGGLFWTSSFFLLGFYTGRGWSRVVERLEGHFLVAGEIAAVAALLAWLFWRLRRARRARNSAPPPPQTPETRDDGLRYP